jgi:hypothetical protein
MKVDTLTARMRQLAPWALILVSAAVAVGAYLQALNYIFLSDDTVYLTENTKLLGLHFTELWRLFIEPYNRYSEFLPLRELSYWFDLTLFGLNSAAFRLHNILLYLLCLPFVYLVTSGIWRYFRPAEAASAPWAAAAVTALFALHPALVESVVWISGRKYVLPNLFAMLALWLALRARREQGFSAPHAVAALLAFVAMMLSKASYVTVAPVIALLWVMFWRDIPSSARRRLQLLWPLAILVLAAILVLIFIASSVGREPLYSGIEAVGRTLAILGWLARLAVTPESRHYFYPVFEDTYFSVMAVLGAAALFAAVAGGVMLLRKRSLEGFALIAFLLLCMPYIQLIPYAPPSLVSDRFLMLAAWPVVLLIVALAWRLNPAPRTVLLLVIALLWGLQTMERPRDWRSYEALVDVDFRAFPGYSMPAMYKSDIQLSQGLIREAEKTAGGITIPEVRNTMIKLVKAHQAVIDSTATGNPHNAMDTLSDFGLDLKQLPVQARWNTSLSVIWRINRKYLEFEWRNLARHFPDDVLLRYNAGSSLLSIQNYADTIIYLRAATESQRLPEALRGTAFKNLGVALLNSGHAAAAEIPLRAALEQSPPELSAYCSLVGVYKQSSRFEEAAHAEAACHKRISNEE